MKKQNNLLESIYMKRRGTRDGGREREGKEGGREEGRRAEEKGRRRGGHILRSLPDFLLKTIVLTCRRHKQGLHPSLTPGVESCKEL